MTVRRAFAIVFSLVILPLVALIAQPGCATLTPAEQAGVARDGLQMGTCAVLAHLCKESVGDASRAPCWADFDRCMASYGFADAGDQ